MNDFEDKEPFEGFLDTFKTSPYIILGDHMQVPGNKAEKDQHRI